MIVKDIEDRIMVELFRPDIFGDEDRKFWGEFQQWIKDCEIELLVNSMFGYIDDVIEKKTSYSGGGMRYNFWMKLEDKESFIDQVHSKFSLETRDEVMNRQFVRAAQHKVHRAAEREEPATTLWPDNGAGRNERQAG